MRALILLPLFALSLSSKAAEIIGVNVPQADTLEITSMFRPSDQEVQVSVSTVLLDPVTLKETSVPTQSARRLLGPVGNTARQTNEAVVTRVPVALDGFRLDQGSVLVRYDIETLGGDGRVVARISSPPGTLSLGANGKPTWQDLRDAKGPTGGGAAISAYPQAPEGSSGVMVSPGAVDKGPVGGGLGSSKANVVEIQPDPQPARTIRARTEAEVRELQDRAARNPLNALNGPDHTVIYFVTNRPYVGFNPQRPGLMFGDSYAPFDKLDKVTYGALMMKTPRGRKLGKLESIEVAGVVGKYAESPFTAEQNQAAVDFNNWIWGQDVLVFIHGYNTSFENAAIQAVQMKADLNFPGPVILFTWPSLGETLGYFTDKGNAKKTISPLADYLNYLAEGDQNGKFPPPGKINVLAHSMGNWVFLNAIGLLNAQKRFLRSSLNKVILAAPDVSRVSFMQWAPVVVSGSKNVTLYYSRKDTALDLSHIIHRGVRAGATVNYVLGVDAIDVDNVNHRWIRSGHSAYSASDKVLTDIALNLLYDVPVWKRSPPLFPTHRELEYFSLWAFPPEPR